MADKVEVPHLPPVPRTPTASDPLGTILGDLLDSSRTLVRQEVALARTEATEKISEQVQTKGKGVALLAGGGIFALLGLAFLGVMLIFGLREWFGLSGWLAALIVTLLYFALAGLLALLGKNILAPAPADSADTTESA